MKSHASMNRSYRLIWSEATQSYCAVAETAKGAKKGGGARTLRRHLGVVLSGVLSSVALSTGLGSLTYAQQAPPGVNASAYFADVKVALLAPKLTQLPLLNNVAQGQVQISQSQADKSAAMTVNQMSDKAVLNWSTFNIGANAQVNFNQPSRTSVTLNRVLDASPSQIFGELNANGQVFLSNPNGIYFSPSAQVDVGGLVATTHAIADADFLSDKMQFDRKGSASGIVNEGHLNAKLGGYIALLAPEVQNGGVIVAQAGTVVMAAGEGVTLKFAQNNSLAGITTTPATIATLVENKLAVQAPGGQIILSAVALNKLQAGVINNSGTLEASSMVSRGGKIILEADAITLTSTSVINANGPLGGGHVVIGGDGTTQDETRPASQVGMQEGAQINANANESGDGGVVLVRANPLDPNSVATLSGVINAKGGGRQGNGGHIETSAGQLTLGALTVNAGAPTGTAGTWLIDPYDYTIDANAATAINAALVNSSVTINTIGNVSNYGGLGNAQGTGNVIINAPLVWSSNSTLTLQAAGNIFINSSISATGASAGVNIFYGGSNSSTAPTAGSFYQFNLNNPGSSFISLPNATSNLYIANQSYTLIESMSQLQAMSPTGVYALGRSLLIPGVYTNSVYTPDFKGVFDGLGNTVSGIQLINSCTATCNIGFFGVASAGAWINNLQLSETFTLTGTGVAQTFSDYSVGGLVGKVTGGTSANPNRFTGDGVVFVSNTNNASKISVNGFWGGGLIGKTYGTTAAPVYANITQSYATLNLDNTAALSIYASSVGGVIGDASASTTSASSGAGAVVVSNTYVSGSINVKQAGYWGVGGLIGQAYGPTVNASNSYTYFQAGSMSSSAGAVSVGGLFGWTTSLTISNSYTTYPGANNVSSGLYYGVSLTGNTTLPSGLSASAWKVSNGAIVLNNLPIPGPSPAPPLYVQETVTASIYGNLSYAYQFVDAAGTVITLGTGQFGGLSGVTGSAAYNLNNTTNAGFYTIYYTGGLTLTGADAAKYALTPYPSAYTINPIAVYVVPTAGQFSVYGTAPNIAFNLTSQADGSGTTYGVNTVSPTGTATFTNQPSATSNVGNYSLSYSGGLSSTNYLFNPAASSVSYSVNPASLTIRGALTNSTYTAAPQINTYAVTGLVNSDKVVSVSGLATGQNVGASADQLSAAVGVGLSNYTISYINGSLNITPAPLTVTGTTTTTVYNATQQANTYTISGLLGADTVPGVTGQARRTNVGTTADNLSITDVSGLGNYDIHYVQGSLSITKAPLILTANNKASFLGDNLNSLDYSAAGLLGNDALNAGNPVQLATSAVNTVAASSAITIGSAQAGVGTDLNNYSITYVPGSYTVIGSGLMVQTLGANVSYGSSASIAPVTVSYKPLNSAAYDLTQSALNAGVYTFVEPVGQANLGAGVSFSITPSNPVLTGSGKVAVGSYGLQLSNLTVIGSQNPVPASSVNGNLTVTPLSASVTAVAASNPYSGSVQTQQITASVATLFNDRIVVNGAATGQNAGSYVSNLVLDANSLDKANYTLSFVNNAYVISPKALSITGTKTYNGSTNMAFGSMSAQNAVLGETVTVIAGSASTASANVGNYNSNLSGLSITVAGNNSVATNYSLPSSGTMSITPAPLSVTGTKVYNGSGAMTFANMTVSDSQNGEVVSLTAGTSTPSANAGTYLNEVISGAALSVSGGNQSASNYLTPTSGTMVITPAPLSVSGTKTYDASTTAAFSTLSASGAQNNETVTVTAGSASTRLANVGTYAASPVSGVSVNVSGGNALASNYSLPSTGTITIAPRTLSVSGSLVYSASAAFTSSNMSLGGVQGSDTINLTAGAATAPSVNANTYAGVTLTGLAISAAGGTLVSNYALPSTGTLVITPAPLSVTGTKTYDGNTSIDYTKMTATGALTGQTLSLTAGTGTLSSANAATGLSATLSGMAFTVTGTGALASNYALPSTASVTISQGTLYVLANPGQSSLYGAVPNITYTLNTTSSGTGSVVTPNSISLVGNATYSITATSSVGSYNNLSYVTGFTSSNYLIAAGSATSYTVNAAALTITGTKVYDGSGAFINTNFSVAGAQNAQSITVATGTATASSSNAGNYNAVSLSNLTLTVPGGSAANYVLPTTANLSITTAPLTITGTKVFNTSTAFTYTNMALTGAKNSEVIALTAGTATTSTANAGTFAATTLSNLAITVTGGNALASNYSLPSSGTMTITQAPLYVIPNASQSSVYGTVPVITYAFNTLADGTGSVVTSLMAGPSGSAVFTGAPSATSNVSSSYALTYASGLSAFNYTFGPASQSVAYAVSKAPLSISGTKVYSGNGAFTFANMTLTGAVNSESIALTAGAALSSSGNVATYAGTNLSALAISVTGGNALSSNYSLPSTGTMTITKAPLSISGSKNYNASTAFAPADMAVSGLVNAESVSLTTAGAIASSANVGSYANTALTNLAVTITGGNASSGNYQLPTSGTMVINALPVSLNGSKNYDGSASIAGTALSVANVPLGGTAVTVGGTATLADRNANATPIALSSLSSLTLSSTNYTLTGASGQATINPANLTVTGTKVYNATTSFGFSNFTLAGAAAGEALTLTAGAASTSSANAGTYNATTLNGLAIGVSGSNTLASNYTLPLSGNLQISALPVVLSGSKNYDGNTTLAGAALTVTNVPNAGVAVTVGGAGTSALVSPNVSANPVLINNFTNYSLSSNNYTLIGATGQASINPIALTVSGSRAYNGSMSFTSSNLSATGAVNAEAVTITAGSASTASANVGSYAATALTGLGITVSGGNANGANYALPSSATMTITRAPITLTTSNVTKTYDGTLSAAGVAVVASGTLFTNASNNSTLDRLSGGTFAYTSAAAGNGNKTVTVSAVTLNDGNAGANYLVTYSNNTTSTVNKAPLGVSLAATYTSSNNVVPSSYFLTGLVNGEVVSSLSGAVLSQGNVASSSTTFVSAMTFGAGSTASVSNYALNSNVNLIQGTNTTNSVSINPAPLGIAITGNYSATTTIVPTSTPSITGLLGGQTMSVASVIAKNQNVSAGNYVTGINLNQNGTTAVMSNYILNTVYNAASSTTTTNALTLQAVNLTLSGSMVYGASTAVPGAALTAYGLNGQTFTVTGAGAAGNVASANVTTLPIALSTVTGLTLGQSINGGISSNYNALGTLGSSLTITPASLGVFVVGTYSGTTAIVPSSVTFTGLLGSDAFSVASVTANSANVLSNGSNYVKSITLNGGGSIGLLGNYVLNTAYNASPSNVLTNAVSLNPLALTVTASASNKVYDATNNATVTLGSAGVISGQSVAFNKIASSFSDKNVGNALTVTVTGISIASVSANTSPSNYTLVNTSATTHANITPATLTVTAQANTKVYDGTTTAATAPIVTGLLGNDTAMGREVYASQNASNSIALNPSVTINDGNAGNNYTVVANAVNGSITKAPLTITAVPYANFVTLADPNNFGGVSYSGLVNAELPGVLGGSVAVTRSNNLVMSAGTYLSVLVPSVAGLTNTNYAITYANGNYTIVPAGQLLIRTNNSSVTYGTAFSAAPSSVQYLSSNGANAYVLNSLTQTSHVGNTFAFSDNAGGTINFTIAANPALAGSSLLSTSNNLVVGNYNIDSNNFSSTGNNFTSVPVFTGSYAVVPAPLSVSAFPTKVYDGTNNLGLISGTLSGKVGNDVVGVSGQGAFASANASNAVNYSVSNLLLSGADQSNYYLNGGNSFSGTNGVIAPKAVTLAPQAVTKVYDATTAYSTTAADLNALSAQLGVANNAVTSATLVYTGSGVGASNKTVTLTALTIADGNGGLNYNVTKGSNAQSTISAATLTVSGSVVSSKVYDGATNAFITAGTLNGIQGNDAVGLTQSGIFLSANANTNIPVTAADVLTGPSAVNYVLLQPSGLAGTITPKALSVSGTTASNKIYDGSTAASIIDVGVLSGLVGNQSLNLSTYANFASPNVGVGTTVNVNYSLLNGSNGGLASNYSLAPVSIAANITPAPLTVMANDAAKFVTQSDPVAYGGVSYKGLVNGETASVVSLGSISSSAVTSNLCALPCVNLPVGTYALTASGFSASNYSISYDPGVLTVIPAGQLLIQVPNQTNTYATANSFLPLLVAYETVAGNVIKDLSLVSANAGSFTYADGASGTVSFTLSASPSPTRASYLSSSNNLSVGNYKIVSTPLTNISANLTSSTPVVVGALAVTPQGLTPNATPSKSYDGTTSIAPINMDLSNKVQGDDVTALGSGQYASRNAGQAQSYSLSGIALSGSDAGNYYLVGGGHAAGTNGVVVPKSITFTSPTENKVYDATVNMFASSADLTTLTAALGVSSDLVSAVTLTYGDKNAGTGKSLLASNAVIADGNSGQNYTLSYTASSNNVIEQAPLKVSALSDTKVYDQTVLSSVLPSYTGLQAGDAIVTRQAFVSPNVLGLNSSVIVPSVLITDGNGTPGANYVVSSNSALGTITPKSLNFTALTPTKTYDASTDLVVPNVNLLGVLANDQVSGVAQGSFASSNVGTGLVYTLNSLVLAGASAANYLPQANLAYTNTNGIINQAPIRLSASKVYDGTTALVTNNLSATGVSGQTLTLTAGSADANSANVNMANTMTGLTGLAIANGTGLASNYTVTSPTIGSVSIAPAPLTLTLSDTIKTFDGQTTVTGASKSPTPVLLTGTLYSNVSNAGAKDSLTGGVVIFTDPAVGDKNKTTNLTGVVVNDGNGGANYSISYVSNTTSSILNPPASGPLLSSAQITGLSGAQISSLMPEQVMSFTAQQIAALSTGQVTGLTAYQIAFLNPLQIQAFTPPQIAAFVPAQVSALTPSQLSSFSAPQLTAFTSASVGVFTSAQISALDAKQIQAFTPSQVGGFTATQMAAMSVQQLKSFSVAQFTTLMPAAVGALSSVQIAQLSSNQVLAMTPAQLSVLSSPQFAAFTNSEVLAFSSSQVGGLSPKVISGISSNLLSNFSNNQLQGLIAPQMAALTPMQVNALTPNQWGVISGSQFSALSPTTVAGLSTVQISQLNAQQLQSLSAQQMSSLNLQQLAVLNTAQIPSLGTQAFTGLTGAQISSLGNGFLQSMSAGQLGAIPPAGVSLISPAQLAVFNASQISGLTAPQVGALSPNQVASMQANQLSALSPLSIGALTPSQASVLSGSQIKSFIPSQIAALTNPVIAGLTLGQIASLSAPQIQSLTLTQVNALQAPQLSSLSPGMLSVFSPAQVGSINPSQLLGLTKSQITTLSSEQMSGFSANQLAALNVAQLAYLSDSQIAALSPSQLSALNSTQLAVLSVPPPPVQSQAISSGNSTSSAFGQTNSTPSAAFPATNAPFGSQLSLPVNSNTPSSGGVAPQGLASQLLSNAVVAQTSAAMQANAAPLPMGSTTANSLDMASLASSGNGPLQSAIQSAPTPELIAQLLNPQAQGPPAPAPQTPLLPSSSATIVVNVLKVPTANTTGLIAVVLPQGALSSGGAVSIPLPEQAIVVGADVKVSLPSNESLPSWISYNPQSQAFEAKGVPIGGLPLTVVVDSGGLRTLILLSENSSK